MTYDRGMIILQAFYFGYKAMSTDRLLPMSLVLVILKLKPASESAGGLGAILIAGPPHEVPDALVLGKVWEFTSLTVPREPDASGPSSILWLYI